MATTVDVGRVFSLDKRIRYCTVLDRAGKTIAGGMRPGVKSLEPEREFDRIGLQMSTIRGIHDTTKDYFGEADYTIIHRKKVMMLILPMDQDRIINVTLEPDYSLNELERLLKSVRTALAKKT